MARANERGIGALKLFGRRLQGDWHAILARGRSPLGTGGVQALNATVKVIKRRAYGYRDEAYALFKIRAAFPCRAQWTKKKPPHGGGKVPHKKSEMSSKCEEPRSGNSTALRERQTLTAGKKNPQR
ncbi:transposase [Pandoraea oxalativorans]|uniref:transposase n=1 Tax=Pandoraea oxalativorans TaxID=573737 RepID=UPI000A005E1C